MGTDIRRQQDVTVKARRHQASLELLAGRILPQVVMFPGILFQVIQLTQPVAMINAQLVSPIPVHRGKGSLTTSKVRIECVKILTANKVP